MNKTELKKKQLKVETYMEVAECECGGYFNIGVSNTLLMTDPPKRNYKCDKCGREATLTESEFPKLTYKYIDEE